MTEKIYIKLKDSCFYFLTRMTPYFRRSLRFCALPYCYFRVINWDICPKSKIAVLSDLLYIFFKLKYYPENYSLCRLWEKNKSEWRNYYGSIYDAYQRDRLRKELQKKEYEILFEDKYVCYQLCKSENLPLPKQYACFYPNDNYRSCIEKALKKNPALEFIIKPVGSKGGRGLYLLAYEPENENIMVRDPKGNCVTLDNFHLDTYSVFQERVKQHPALSKISTSTNTFRIVTMITKNNNIIILGAKVRFGKGDTFIDNTSSGGVGVGIYIDTGILMKDGFDSKGRQYDSHPATGVVFEGVQVPEWQNIIDLVKNIQSKFPYYRMLGHDIALTDKGPVIIEINAAHDNIMLEQSCGPILENNITRQAFEEYGLLIN